MFTVSLQFIVYASEFADLPGESLVDKVPPPSQSLMRFLHEAETVGGEGKWAAGCRRTSSDAKHARNS